MDKKIESVKIVNCSILDINSGKWNNNLSIIIKGGLIKKIGKENDIGEDNFNESSNKNRTLNARNSFVIPGMIDLHTHISFDGTPLSWSINSLLKDKPGYRSVKATIEAGKYLNSGFTTIRELGSLDYDDFNVKRAIEEGLVRGPRIFTSGKALSMTGGHGDLWVRSGSHYPSFGKIVDGVENVRLATRELIKMGADWVKILGTGGVASEGDLPDSSQFTLDELKSSIYEAHASGRKVAVHAHGSKGIKLAAEAGTDTIEHGSLLLEDEELAKELSAKGIGFVPTLSVTDRVVSRGPGEGLPGWAIEKAEKNIEMHRESVKIARKEGVLIGLGTDAGYMVRHGESAYELELLNRVGLSNLECIKAGTLNAARILGYEKSLGSIEEGKIADLVVLNFDPLENIKFLQEEEKILSVVKAGEIINGKDKLGEG